MTYAEALKTITETRISYTDDKNPWDIFFQYAQRPGEDFDTEITGAMVAPFLAFMREWCPVVGSRTYVENGKKTGDEICGYYLREGSDEAVMISLHVCYVSNLLTAHMLETEHFVHALRPCFAD